jgi:hypothetical protein
MQVFSEIVETGRITGTLCHQRIQDPDLFRTGILKYYEQLSMNTNRYMKKYLLPIIFSFFFFPNRSPGQIPYPGKNPGKASVRTTMADKVILENNAVRMEFIHDGNNIWIAGFTDINGGYSLKTNRLPLFELTLHDGSRITSDDFDLTRPPVISDITGDSGSTIYAKRLTGKKYSAHLENMNYGLSLQWEANLRDGSNYIRQVFRFYADNPENIRIVTLIKLKNADAGIKGTVDGSPIVLKNMFFTLEYPLSQVEQQDNAVTASLTRIQNKLSTVWGVSPTNQLRRGFLYYVERERSHPYHQVLHYNSWFDISWEEPFSEEESLDRIKTFGDSLINKRKVPLKAFLLDDGWDDHQTLWGFHEGFPDGFDRVKQMADSYNSSIGVWLSPFGGYGEAKRLRLKYGKRQAPPFETNARGFSMAGPVYYNRFKEVTTDFIKKYDVSMFKFDGLGAGSDAQDVYKKDVEAFLNMMRDLQDLKPEIYISITTGTWPSVHWLQYGDNIWRGGMDTHMIGEGSIRQQWITYRDADVYENVVKRGPLFPLNALMLCGICIADKGNPGTFEMDDNDIADEIWSFFATGTNLQELYINPHKLNPRNWDCLADAARWARENESVLVDTHWVGGDPARGEIYGYASWSKEKGILSLRNPSSAEQTYKVEMSKVFDLPAQSMDSYKLYDIRKMRETGKQQIVHEGKSCLVILSPFEHKLYEAIPAQ